MASLAYKVVSDFEETIAEYAGSKYAVAVESGSAALFLCCVYKKVGTVIIPRYTYPSVPAGIIHAGGRVQFEDEYTRWVGIYELYPFDIWDGALRFKRGMYRGGLHCLSFHSKKLLPIGRGGMILTDDEEAMKWFKLMRFDGRPEAPLSAGVKMVGWNMYMTPEQAARGLMLFDLIKNEDLPDLVVEDQGYIDLSKLGIYAP
jgi:dTDP-4-amino-4,6-dideoxygalactose transaminase